MGPSGALAFGLQCIILGGDAGPLRPPSDWQEPADCMATCSCTSEAPTENERDVVITGACSGVTGGSEQKTTKGRAQARNRNANAHFCCTSATAKVRDGSLNGRVFFTLTCSCARVQIAQTEERLRVCGDHDAHVPRFGGFGKSRAFGVHAAPA